MNDAEQILFEVIVDIPKVKENAEIALTALARLRKEKADTEKEFKKGDIGAEEYGKSMLAINTAITNVSTNLKGYQKTLADNDKSQKSAQGSLNQMKANLSLLRKEYDDLPLSIIKGTKAGQELQAHIKSLSDELKSEEAAIGSNSRNVGNYTQSIEAAIAGNNSWSSRVRLVSTTLTDAKNILTNYVSGLRATTEGMSLAEKASVGLGVGLKAIGIGLIITAIAGLLSFLSRMDAGMDKVEQATAALGAGFEAFLKVISPIGEVLVEAFTHPIDSIVNFGKALLHPIDSLVALGKAALNMGRDAADGVSKAASAAVAYTKAMQDLEDRQDGLIGVQAKVNEQVQLALIAAKDRSKSEAERIKLLDDAGAAEIKLSRETVAIKKAEYDELKKLQAGKDNLQDADRKASRQAYAEYVNARAASAQTEQQIQNRRSSLIEQEIAEDKKQTEAAKKEAIKRAQARVDEAEAAVIVAKRKGEDTVQIEQELYKRQLKLIDAKEAAEKAAVDKGTGYNQKIKLIEAKAASERIELAKVTALKIADITYQAQVRAIETSLAFTQRGSKEELQAQIDSINAVRAKQQIEAKNTIKDKQTLLEEDIRITAAAARKIADAQEAFEKNQVTRGAEAAQRMLQVQLDLGDDSLVNERDVAAKRIDLEEKTQIALLDVEKKYGQLTDAEYEERLEAIKATRIKANTDLTNQLKIDALNEQKAINEIRLNSVKQGSKAELQARLDSLKLQEKAEQASAGLTMKQTVAISTKYRRAEGEAEGQFNQQRVQLILDSFSSATDVVDKLVQAQIQRDNKLLQERQDAELKSVGLSAEARTKIEEKYAAKKEELDRKSAEKQRKIATIQNIIATARAVTEAQILPPPFDIIKTVLAIATGAAQQAVIASQQFAHGGEIDGPSHAQGGVKYRVGNRIVELEGGEGVVNKRSMAMPGVRQKISELNQLGGGIAFPNTLKITTPMSLPAYNPVRLEYGGDVLRSVGVPAALIDYNKLAKAMAAQPAPIVRVSNIRDGVAKQVRVEDRADIGG